MLPSALGGVEDGVGGYSLSNKAVLLSALTFHQYWTVSTLDVLFQMVCASTIGRYYYRDLDPGSHSTSRTVTAFLNTFTKSLGTACFFGILQHVIKMMHKVKDPWIPYLLPRFGALR